MKDYKTTLDRLLKILNRLYLGELLSVLELADEFGVSQRTIQRYFNNYLQDFPLKKFGRKWGINNCKIEINKESEIAFSTLEKLSKEAGIYPKIKNHLEKLRINSTNIFHTHLKVENINDKFDVMVLLEKGIKEKKL